MSCMTFAQKGRYVNLARIDPRLLSTVTSKRRRQLNMGSSSAICLTPIFSTLSSLTEPNSFKQKSLSGMIHSQEFDRMAGVVCMVYGYPEVKAPLYKSSLAFTTLARTDKSTYLHSFRLDPTINFL